MFIKDVEVQLGLQFGFMSDLLNALCRVEKTQFAPFCAFQFFIYFYFFNICNKLPLRPTIETRSIVWRKTNNYK